MRSTTAAKRTLSTARGFTLLEVMIVIGIILLIAGLVTVNLMGSRAEATKGTVEIQLRSMRDALKQFNLAFNRFPTEEEGLAVLWSKATLDPQADATKWRAFLEQPIPNDPWGTAWGYAPTSEQAPEGMFDLWSNGPDKEANTADDIRLWKNTDKSGADSGASGDAPPPPPPPASSGSTPPG